jgi:hypothetical protein
VVIKNHWLSGRDIPVRINARGFRGDDVAAEPTRGVPRILMLGDSITWGDYVRDEETYVRQTANVLEAPLAIASKSSTPVSVTPDHRNR